MRLRKSTLPARGFLHTALVALALLRGVFAQSPAKEAFDVVVYGGTPAAITAAIEADRLGMRTVLVSPDKHLGGMTSSGLGWTDTKDTRAIGGLAREFYHRIWSYYRDPLVWKNGDLAVYEKLHAQSGLAINNPGQVMWTFEPHVAEKTFEDMLAASRVSVFRDEWLDRKNGVQVLDHWIRRIRTLSGKIFAGKVFIDGSYEGDLMAAAGIGNRVGRDAASDYRESLNGIYFRPLGAKYYEDDVFNGISPYIMPGNPASGLIAGIESVLSPGEKAGDADHRLQSFNYRLCLTADKDDRVAIAKPEAYKRSDYELLLRLYEAGHPSGFSVESMPNRKTDSNNRGLMSLDFIGGSFSVEGGWDYSDASYEQRAKIIQAHRDYTQGLLWTIMNDVRVPEEDRRKWAEYGLAKDEFVDNGNWPYQLYVREARRMVGLDVITQHHIQQEAGYEIRDPVGLGSYSLDSHTVRRVVVDGKIRTEGGFYVPRGEPYPIGYGALVPKREEIRNLLDPVTLSATHAAFGSIRMEPTYMILGQSAGAAAALAVQNRQAVQDVSYAELRARLLADGQELDVPPKKLKPTK